MPNPNEDFDLSGPADNLAHVLLELNSDLTESIYTGVATTITDRVDLIQHTVAATTRSVLDTLEEHVTLVPHGYEAEDQFQFKLGDVRERFDRCYLQSINS